MSDNSEAIKVMEAFLSGDFTARSERDDELSSTVNRLGDYMESILRTNLEGTVGTCIGSFDIVASLAHMSNGISSMEERALAMAAATEEMATTTQQIAEHSDEAASSSERALDVAYQGSESVKSAVELMQDMSDSVRKAMTEVEQLEHFSGEIGAIVESIQRIAGQTNMLALNATIEAARAGEAGKGFAVVAGEVKELSQQTATAAKEIRNKIEQLQSEIKDVVDVINDNAEKADRGSQVAESAGSSMLHVIEAFQSVMGIVEHIKHASHDQGSASTEIAQGTAELSTLFGQEALKVKENVEHMQQFEKGLTAQLQVLAKYAVTDGVLSLAKSDHMLWKKRLVDMMFGYETIRPEEVSDHKHCRLGKWYYQDGQQAYGTHDAFKKLEAPHARVHELARSAVQKFSDGDVSGAMKDIDAVTEPSDLVVKLLEDLQKSD